MNSNKLPSYFILFSVIGIGAAIGILAWSHISAAYNNPTQTFGPLARAGISPKTNLLRYVVFLCSVTGCMFLAATIRPIRNLLLADEDAQIIDNNRHFFSHKPLFVILSAVLLTVAGHYYFIETPPGPNGPMMDHYHNGIITSATVAAEHHLSPFKQYIPTRGILIDVYKSLLAFDLFGRSQASLIIMDTILQVAAFLAFCLLFVVMFRGNFLATFLASVLTMCFTLINYVVPARLGERDGVYALLAAGLFLIHEAKGIRSLRIWAYLLAMIPPLAYTVSMDRGYISTVVVAIAWPIIYCLILDDTNAKRSFVISSLSGFVTGVLILGWLIEWNFREFFHLVFVDTLTYRGFVEGLEYQITLDHIRGSIYRVYALLIQALVAAWLFYQVLAAALSEGGSILQRARKLAREKFPDIMLGLIALGAFMYALNHTDRQHIATGAAWSTIFLVYVFIRYHLPYIVENSLGRKAVSIVLVLMALGATSVFVNRMFVQGRIIAAYPMGKTDDEMLTPEYRETLEFLRRHVNNDNLFVSLTNEGSWYYLLNRPCPIQFSEIWLASSSEYQTKVIEQMRTQPISYVLYSNEAPWGHIDDVSMRERVPRIFQYVEQHFQHFKQFGSQDLWIRRDLIESQASPSDSTRAPALRTF